MGGGTGPACRRLALVSELPVADWLWRWGARMSLTSCSAGQLAHLSGYGGLGLVNPAELRRS